MKSYTLRPDTFTLNFNFTLSGTKVKTRSATTPDRTSKGPGTGA